MPSRNAWTDQVYRLANFLYWEPQHINQQKRKKGDMQAHEMSMNKIRTLEVPLNLLFNIVLRLSPQRVKRRILGSFVAVPEANFGERAEYISIYDRLPDENIDFIQPDAVLESELANICIELKINAPLSTDQAYKYLALLGLWATKPSTAKKSYLFFLTKKSLRAQWKPQERATIFTASDDLAGLSNYLKSADLPPRFNWTAASVKPAKMIKKVQNDIQLGWATWQTIGDVLHTELNSSGRHNPSEGGEVLQNLLGDFLADLEQRRLWES